MEPKEEKVLFPFRCPTGLGFVHRKIPVSEAKSMTYTDQPAKPHCNVAITSKVEEKQQTKVKS